MLWRRRGKAPIDPGHQLHLAVVAQARQPGFYRDCAVPDTLDGRFEMIALHAFLVLRRLRGEGAAGRALGQRLFDILIDDLDRSLREMGVGDLGVGKRVKAMGAALYGRLEAYDSALAGGAEAIAGALRRNLYGTIEPDAKSVEAMAEYLRREAAPPDRRTAADLLAGRVLFGPPPG